MCQWCVPCQSQEQCGFDEDHECGRNVYETTRDRRDLIREGKMRIQNESKPRLRAEGVGGTE